MYITEYGNICIIQTIVIKTKTSEAKRNCVAVKYTSTSVQLIYELKTKCRFEFKQKSFAFQNVVFFSRATAIL